MVLIRIDGIGGFAYISHTFIWDYPLIDCDSVTYFVNICDLYGMLIAVSTRQKNSGLFSGLFSQPRAGALG